MVAAALRHLKPREAPGATDFSIELAQLDGVIVELGSSAFTPPVDGAVATRFAHAVYQRAALTGDVAEIEAAQEAVDRAIGHVACPSDLYFLKANLAFKLHRLDEVRRSLLAAPALAVSPEGRTLQADLDFQEGRYPAARRGYEAALTSGRTWDNLARLAYLVSRMGATDQADRLYAEAEDELTAKEMRSFAWVELQRGLLNLAHGRHEAAQAHYERAGRAYSGYWLVEEHQAELLAARGHFAEAAALFESVIAQAPRPELQQALGELYTVMGKRDRAGPLLDRALSIYLASAQAGGVHYYHHLADFYADVLKDGAEAMRWARRDLALRQNHATRAALAWACHRAGRTDEAVDLICAALASGVRQAHLFSQAAAIFAAAGEAAKATNCRQLALAINPHHRCFHVHR